jgi:hypothetical protein
MSELSFDCIVCQICNKPMRSEAYETHYYIHDLESQLAAANSEIKRWCSDNQRLRETIQRNEDKSVECERLKAEILLLRACPICKRQFSGNNPHWNCGDTMGSVGQSQSALDGGKA